jgi:hypothetical protein
MEFQLNLPWEERDMDVVQLLDADDTHLLLMLVFIVLALGAGLIPNYRSK